MKRFPFLMAWFALLASLTIGCRPPNGPVPVTGNGPPFDTLNFVWHVKTPWNFNQGGNSNLRPLMPSDSAVIFGFGEGFICLNTNTGATIWQNEIGINPSGYPKGWEAMDMLLENGRIYTLAGDIAIRGAKASVVCLSATSGQLIWRHDLIQDDNNPLNGYFSFYWSKYASSPTAIFYSTQSGHVVALSKTDGSVLWDSPNGCPAKPFDMSEPCYRNGVVYAGSCPEWQNITNGVYRDGVVVAFDANTGKVIWTKTIPPPDSLIIGYSNWKLLNDNEILVAPLPTDMGIIICPGFCVALMDSSGNLAWRSSPNVNGGLSPYIWQPFFENGQIYGYNTGNGDFFAFDLDAAKGIVNWVRSASQRTSTIHTPEIDSAGLYEVTDDVISPLWGQSRLDGSTFLYTPLFWYMNYSDDAFNGDYLVQDKRVYYQTYDEIICLERK